MRSGPTLPPWVAPPPPSPQPRSSWTRANPATLHRVIFTMLSQTAGNYLLPSSHHLRSKPSQGRARGRGWAGSTFLGPRGRPIPGPPCPRLYDGSVYTPLSQVRYILYFYPYVFDEFNVRMCFVLLSWPPLYSNLLYKIGQDFLKIQ